MCAPEGVWGCRLLGLLGTLSVGLLHFKSTILLTLVWSLAGPPSTPELFQKTESPADYLPIEP